LPQSYVSKPAESLPFQNFGSATLQSCKLSCKPWVPVYNVFSESSVDHSPSTIRMVSYWSNLPSR